MRLVIMKKELLNAVFAFMSISVGAGVLALPYVFLKSGFFTALIILLIISLVMLILYLFLGEIVLRTKGRHQLAGLAEKYLGKKGKQLMFIFSTAGIYGALLAYTIGAGQALNSIYNWNVNYYSIIFFTAMSLTIFYGRKIFQKTESALSMLKILFVAVIGIILITKLEINSLLEFDIEKIYLPYGAVMFSLLAVSAIPQMGEGLRNKKILNKAIIYAMISTVIVYLIFTLGMIAVSDGKAELTTTELSGITGIIANLFALFALSTAFIGLGYALKESLIYDYLFGKTSAWLITISVPIALYLLDFRSFIKVIEFTGSVAGGLILLLILLMHSKAKELGNREPEYSIPDNKFLKVILGALFVLGIILPLL